jgi:hypothetical protein
MIFLIHTLIRYHTFAGDFSATPFAGVKATPSGRSVADLHLRAGYPALAEDRFDILTLMYHANNFDCIRRYFIENYMGVDRNRTHPDKQLVP